MMGPIKLLKAEDFKALVNGKGDNMGARLGAIYGPESAALFTEIDTLAPRVGNQRGSGVSDMAAAIVEGRRPRVSADLCRHVTEGINAFDVSVRTGVPYQMTTTSTRCRSGPFFRRSMYMNACRLPSTAAARGRCWYRPTRRRSPEL
jgi:hypothetical protein